jgi:hypothetical protein
LRRMEIRSRRNEVREVDSSSVADCDVREV